MKKKESLNAPSGGESEELTVRLLPEEALRWKAMAMVEARSPEDVLGALVSRRLDEIAEEAIDDGW